MRAKYADKVSTESLLDPDAGIWNQSEAQTLDLQGAPLGLQPTTMIRNSWADKDIGAVKKVTVAALHNGSHLAFRLSWADASEDLTVEDNNQFVDAAALLLPTKAYTPLMTMGAPGLEANMWYWRADQPTGRHVVAEGIGATRTIDETNVLVAQKWQAGQWTVVIARALNLVTNEPVVQLQTGHTLPFAVAIWEGSQGERAGIKSITPAYTPLILDPTNG